MSFFLPGCVIDYIQLFEVESNEVNLKDNYLVFENDIFIVVYKFWSYKGKMTFILYNKSDVPIFIDWKQSSLIINDRDKIQYWQDIVHTTTSGESVSVASNVQAFYPNNQPFTIENNSTQINRIVSQSISIKPERISIIPPKSAISKTTSEIFPYSHFIFNDPEVTTVPKKERYGCKSEIISQVFSEEKSPLKIRNYIAFKSKEESTDLIYLDNSFYLQNVADMTLRQFRGKKRGQIKQPNGTFVTDYERPLKSSTNFYLIYKGYSTNRYSTIKRK